MCVHVELADFYQEGAEHVEADEVDDGEAAATVLPLLPRLRVTRFTRHTGQHYLLPRLTCRTPGEEKGQHINL